MKAIDQDRRCTMGLWAATGFAAGALIRSASLWPEFLKRLHWAWSGGGGESAVWGEPLFYMAVLGIPAGLVGGAVAFAAASITCRLRHPM